jgi:hypothetical protein
VRSSPVRTARSPAAAAAADAVLMRSAAAPTPASAAAADVDMLADDAGIVDDVDVVVVLAALRALVADVVAFVTAGSVAGTVDAVTVLPTLAARALGVCRGGDTATDLFLTGDKGMAVALAANETVGVSDFLRGDTDVLSIAD